MALTDIQALVADQVRDEASAIATAERDRAIAVAVKRYSSDRPRQLVVDVTSAGGQVLDLPAGWVAEFSRLVAVEHPVDQIPPSLMAEEDFWTYARPAGVVIQLASSISAGATVRLTFTVPHELDADTDTIPEGDREAMSCWAAAFLLDQLATRHSGDRQSTLHAEVAHPVELAMQYAKRAATCRARYFAELGLDEKRTAPAATTVEFTPRDDMGHRRLFHPGRMS
ncbi:MAG: hypothetical protein GC150_15370 [Rhizobiales bacterium]|nr:hypothetical protein [Hyphomicrobiales bacterium]